MVDYFRSFRCVLNYSDASSIADLFRVGSARASQRAKLTLIETNSDYLSIFGDQFLPFESNWAVFDYWRWTIIVESCLPLFTAASYEVAIFAWIRSWRQPIIEKPKIAKLNFRCLILPALKEAKEGWKAGVKARVIIVHHWLLFVQRAPIFVSKFTNFACHSCSEFCEEQKA